MIYLIFDILIVALLVVGELRIGKRLKRMSVIVDTLFENNHSVDCQNGISSSSTKGDHTTDSLDSSGNPNISKHFSTQKNVEP